MVGPNRWSVQVTPADVDIESVLKAYNLARALNPDRIENTVADAPIARRLGENDECGKMLRKAMLTLNVGMDRAPPEILLESFRLSEVEGAPALDQAGILLLALKRDPRLAGIVRQQANKLRSMF